LIVFAVEYPTDKLQERGSDRDGKGQEEGSRRRSWTHHLGTGSLNLEGDVAKLGVGIAENAAMGRSACAHHHTHRELGWQAKKKQTEKGSYTPNRKKKLKHHKRRKNHIKNPNKHHKQIENPQKETQPNPPKKIS